MDSRTALLSKIEDYLSASGMGSHRFGHDAVGDTKLVRRLRTGKGVTLTTIEKVEAFIRSKPPALGEAV